MVKRVCDYKSSIPRNVAVVGFFFMSIPCSPTNTFFFKREEPSITIQVAAERGEAIFHDAQIITV